MSHEKPNYQDKLKEKLDNSSYRTETVAYIGHVCRMGRVSEQSVLSLLNILEEDARLTASEVAHDAVFCPGVESFIEDSSEALEPGFQERL
jgi:hypothetical protein